MEDRRSRILLGLLLVVGGIVFLLMSLDVIPGDSWPVLWITLFALGGLAFLSVFVRNPDQWWPIIPGMTLLGLATLIGLETFAPQVGDTWGAAIFMGSISLAFWIIYAITGAEEWWAIIPGGVLLTIAAIIALSSFAAEEFTGGVFMLGMSFTFLLVYLLPGEEERSSWPLFPAGILGLIGLFLVASAVEVLAFVWPVALLLAGGYLILRALRAR
jgi:hypothetical protein